MWLTVSRKTVQILAVRRENWHILITVSRKKKLTEKIFYILITIEGH